MLHIIILEKCFLNTIIEGNKYIFCIKKLYINMKNEIKYFIY